MKHYDYLVVRSGLFGSVFAYRAKPAEKYRKLASQEKNVIFGGRLADYKYYDMAPVVELVLNIPIQ